MAGLILGIDICDDYSQISVLRAEAAAAAEVDLSDDGPVSVPTVICKKKGADVWLIGEEAYRTALLGGGTVVDRLVRLVQRDGTATIEGVCYSAEDLLQRFVEQLLTRARKDRNEEEVVSLVYTVHALEGTLNDMLVRVTEACGVPRERIRIVSHTESSIYYVLAQAPDVWANQTCLFDLREDGLFYYEMRVVRGRRPQVVEADHLKLPEGFSLEVLETPSGERLGDTILRACAERLMTRKLISAVFLTGRGFETTDWAKAFLKYICNKRRVFAVPKLFAQGAAHAACDALREKTRYPYLFACEGRIGSTVSLYAVSGGRREQIVLAAAGSNWYEARSSVEFIVDDVRTVELTVTPVGSARVETILLPLDDLPQRPNKTTRIEIIVSFLSEQKMTVRVVDKGFGDLFPSTGMVIRQDAVIGGAVRSQ